MFLSEQERNIYMVVYKMFLTAFQVPAEEEKAASSKGRRASQASPVSKPAEGFVNPIELSPSISGPTRVVIDVSETSPSVDPAQLQTKNRSRRKSGIVKALSKRESRRSETTTNKRPAYPFNSAVDLKVPYLQCHCTLHRINSNSLVSFTLYNFCSPFVYCRRSYLIVCQIVCSGGGSDLNGSTVLLITHGLLKMSLWST